MIISDAWNWAHDADGTAVPAEAMWDSAEPLVIHVSFYGKSEPVHWMFARDLLRAAFREGEAGTGDVNIKIDDGILVLTLDSPFGKAVMRSEARWFAGFLTSTQAVTPAGDEDLGATIDAALDEILGRRG